MSGLRATNRKADVLQSAQFETRFPDQDWVESGGSPFRAKDAKEAFQIPWMTDAAVMKIDGRCHCGRVTYEAVIDPSSVRICHCVDCQSLTGSAYRVTVRAAKEDITITAGSPKIYTRSGDNGLRRFQYFCDQCGSPLFTSGEGEDSAIWGIRWGSITQRKTLSPSSQIWRRSAADWVDNIKGLPAHDKD